MTELLTHVVDQLGYGGIFLLLILARAAPPVSAETVIPIAGVAAAHGQLSLVAIAVAGGLGSAVGELVWYVPARCIGRARLERFLARHERWLTVPPETVARAAAWFGRYGGLAVLLAQAVPGVRTMISIPAGACGLPVARFLAYAAAGSTLWVAVLASTGWALQHGLPNLAAWIGWIAVGVFVVVTGTWFVRVVRAR